MTRSSPSPRALNSPPVSCLPSSFYGLMTVIRSWDPSLAGSPIFHEETLERKQVLVPTFWLFIMLFSWIVWCTLRWIQGRVLRVRKQLVSHHHSWNKSTQHLLKNATAWDSVSLPRAAVVLWGNIHPSLHRFVARVMVSPSCAFTPLRNGLLRGRTAQLAKEQRGIQIRCQQWHGGGKVHGKGDVVRGAVWI